MAAKPKRAFAVVLCDFLVRAAAMLVPRDRRPEWRQEWTAEIWHRWQFLLHAGLWDRREAFALIRNCCGAFPDAAWHFASQDAVRHRVREWARSPWTCLGAFAALLLLVAVLSSGLPATRELFLGPHNASDRLVFIWLHPIVGGGDKGLPPDVVPAWKLHSQLLESVAPFNISYATFAVPGRPVPRPLVITTQPALFDVFRVRPQLGTVAAEHRAVVLDHRAWVSLFHARPGVIGSKVRIGRTFYPVEAVLPARFEFLSRHASVYLVQPFTPESSAMIVARARPGVTAHALDKELTRISENVCYYFFTSQLRISFFKDALWTPVRMFAIAALLSAILTCMVSRVHMRNIRPAWSREHRAATRRRVAFFSAKLMLAFAVVFVAALEWSRPESSLLYASRDPASGPFLVWLYILGTMGVLFWSVADQRARCRVCLRLLCFPVRVGCPGCLLLDWSGTELFCSEGHGLLHVPDLAPSWDEESQHWIALDESWRGLFAHSK